MPRSEKPKSRESQAEKEASNQRRDQGAYITFSVGLHNFETIENSPLNR
jgi:hypothetical protein